MTGVRISSSEIIGDRITRKRLINKPDNQLKMEKHHKTQNHNKSGNNWPKSK